uniref:Uncharacterized protein n=2 Tax=Triticum urartu TaxID=4572 RepID=A0A8R7V717_TRIUA
MLHHTQTARNSLVHKVRRFIRISGVAPKEQLAGNTLMDHELMPIILCRYSQIDMESDLEPPTSHRARTALRSELHQGSRSALPRKSSHTGKRVGKGRCTFLMPQKDFALLKKCAEPATLSLKLHLPMR